MAEKGHKDSITCDCGIDFYNNLPINKDKNPLTKIIPDKEFNKKVCCLRLKAENSAEKQALKLIKKGNKNMPKQSKTEQSMMKKLSDKNLFFFKKNFLIKKSTKAQNNKKYHKNLKKAKQQSVDLLEVD